MLRVVPERSIFIVVKGHGVGNVFPGISAVIGRDLAAFIPYEPLNKDFFAFLLEEVCGQLVSSARGHIPGLSRDLILELQIMLPPLDEQARIIQRVNQASDLTDATMTRLADAKGHAETMRDSIFSEAFSGKMTEEWRRHNLSPGARDRVMTRETLSTDRTIPGRYGLAIGRPGSTVPQGWEWVRLSDVAQLRTGHTPSRRRPEYWTGDIPWISVTDASEHDGEVITDTMQHISSSGLENSAADMLPVGTICWTRTGSFGYVVTTGEPMTTSQHFLNWTCGPSIDSSWLRWLLIAERKSIEIFGRGSHHKTIYFEDAGNFHVLLPPYDEQNEISKEISLRLAALSGVIVQIDEAENAAVDLNRQTRAAALAGELDTGEPGDEPVESLLDRLETEIEVVRNVPDTEKAHGSRPSEPTVQSLAEIVLSDPEGLSPEALFAAGGYRLDAVDVFFGHLKEAVKLGRVSYDHDIDRIVRR